MQRARLKEVTKYSKDNWVVDGDGIIQRAGSGHWENIADYKDYKYDAFHPRVMQYDVRGAYHYLRSNTSWRSQADDFLSVVQDDFHFHICDFEETGNVLGPTFVAMCAEWCIYVAAKTGKPVLVYSNRSIYNDYLAKYDFARISQFGFHYAYPTEGFATKPNLDTLQPVMPTRAPRWDVLQVVFGEHRAEGTELDVYNGTVDDMKAWLKLAPPIGTPPPTLEERVSALEQRMAKAGL